MKHTKGKWIENPKARGNIQSEDTGRSIASCMGFSSTVNSDKVFEENLANAKLIAAAPKLLEALSNLVNAASGDTFENLKIAIIDAKAIIKKTKYNGKEGS